MRKNDQTAVFAKQLGETLTTDAERTAFERHVALLVASAEMIRVADERREQLGWSKAQLARELDVKPSVVSRLLTGKGGTPDLGTLAAVYDKLGLYLDVRIKPQPKRGERHAAIEVSGDPVAA